MRTGADAAIAMARADHRAWHNRGGLSESEHRKMREGLVRSYFAEERRWPNWCAAFVAHALETAGVPVPRKGAPRRGAQALTRWVADHGRWIVSPQNAKDAARMDDLRDWLGSATVPRIEPGDVICWKRPPLGWRGHVGLLLAVHADGAIEIAEGNADGGQLVIRTLGPDEWPTRLSGLYGVARPDYGGGRMTTMELALECKRVIESEFGLNKVCLTIPGPPPRGERVRLDRTSRRKCPIGEVSNWQDDPPRTVAYFDAVEVLAWLHANGLVDVEVTGPKYGGAR